MGIRSAAKYKEEISPILLRRLKKDVLIELPDKTFQDINLEMSGKQLRMYEQMKENMYVALGNGKELDAVNVLTQLMRLKQITTSPDILLDNEELSGCKLDAINDILDGSGEQKVVIFSQFATFIKKLIPYLKKQGYNACGFTGDDSTDYRTAQIKKFQEDPKADIFCVTIQSGGTGITLTAGSIAIFVDHMWTPAINSQALDRLHRIGQKENVYCMNLIVNDSVDTYIQEILQDKQALFDSAIPNTRISNILKEGFNEKRF
jgi:SNF2 family DNA or RNA helicase